MVQLRHRHHRAGRAVLAQRGGVEAVELRPMRDAGDIHRDLEQIRRGAAAGVQDGQQIAQRYLRLFGK